MTWNPDLRSCPEDHEAFVFIESEYRGFNRIRGPLLVEAWVPHQSAANETLMTHWWDGDGEPTEPPDKLVRTEKRDAPDWAVAALQKAGITPGTMG